EFHRSIVAATHHRVFMQLYDVICMLLLEYQRPLYAQYADAEAELHEHRLLFDAIEQRDLDRVQRLIAEHNAGARAVLAHFLDESNREDRARQDARVPE